MSKLKNMNTEISTAQNYETENHPDPSDGFFPTNPTSIIIGTFPPVLKTEEQKKNFFYYPSSRNSFWKILGDTFSVPLCNEDLTWDEKVKLRKDFLSKNRIAMTDMILKCKRQIKDSSEDKDLEVIVTRDIRRILSEHITINTIYLTSGKSTNGAEQLFRRSISIKGKNSYYLPSKGTNDPKVIETELCDRKINIITLPSPSHRNGISDEKKKEQYKKYFRLNSTI